MRHHLLPCILLCQVAIEIPYTLLQAAFYAVIVYAMMGYEWTATKFFLNFFFVFITILYFIYYGLMVIAVSPNQATAAVLSGVFYSVWNLFTGFVIPRTVRPRFVCDPFSFLCFENNEYKKRKTIKKCLVHLFSKILIQNSPFSKTTNGAFFVFEIVFPNLETGD